MPVSPAEADFSGLVWRRGSLSHRESRVGWAGLESGPTVLGNVELKTRMLVLGFELRLSHLVACGSRAGYLLVSQLSHLGRRDSAST